MATKPKSYVGKLVDTWIYEFPALQTIEGDEDTPAKEHVGPKKVTVELRLHKTFVAESTPPLATKTVTFSLRCAEAGIRLEGSDIEALRVAMWGKLDAKYATRWESYYLVDLTPSFDHWRGGLGAGMSFTYRTVDKGTAWDGTQILREYRNTDWVVSPWPKAFRDGRGKILACFPVNDENTLAMERFAEQVNALRKRIGQFLLPENIDQTLRYFAGADANVTGLLENVRLETPAIPDRGDAEDHDGPTLDL